MFIEYLRRDAPAYTQWIHIVPGVRVCRFRSGEKRLLTLQKHESSDIFEVFFCLDGEITAMPAGTGPQKIEKHHILVLSDTAELHPLQINENLQGILVAVDLPLFQKDPPALLPPSGLNIDLCRLKSNLAAQHGCVALCNRCWSQAVFDLRGCLPDDIFCRYCVFKALELLYILSAKSFYMEHLAAGPENPQPPQTILHVRSYLETHLSEKITIADLSRMLSVSPTYLKAEFRRIHGISIHRCLIDLRMRKAGELILCTNRPLYKIAQDVGYEGMSQFSIAFKKYYGTTPGQFKKMSKTGI